MRAQLTSFVQALRAAGVRISVAETLDAMVAVRAAGIEPRVLREALSATLVKDEADRSCFDDLFDSHFTAHSLLEAARRRRNRRGPLGGDPAAGSAASGGGATGSGSARPPESTPSERSPQSARTGARPDRREATPVRPPPSPRREPTNEPKSKPIQHTSTDRPEQRAIEPGRSPEGARASGQARGRQLHAVPFRELEPFELGRARQLARELGRRFLARASRRERAQRRGRADIRRTIRASLARGGALIDIKMRGRRPGRPRLVALCDVSGSVAMASELLLELLSSCEGAFSRVTRFAFVDRLVPIGLENGHIVPEGPLDLFARSDLGAVLGDLERDHAELLDRSTVLLVLGDGRNNYRPPRADLLKRLAARARAVVFIIPEARERWNTGDSALAAYTPTSNLMLEAVTIGGLARALRAARRAARVAAPAALG